MAMAASPSTHPAAGSPPPRVRRLYALVPCAGFGSRSGADLPKQYVPLAGDPMVAHTLRALEAVETLQAVLVVLSPQDAMFESLLPGFASPRGWISRQGGATRADTVAAGLQELRQRGAESEDWVLVHDAARCLLRPAWVRSLIEACALDEVGGLLAWPVADTLKEEVSGRAARTIPRAAKWAAQTPQMFPLGLLQDALRHAGSLVTDEASAVESLGHLPRLVRGSMENFKVTFPEDFALAERLLRTTSAGDSP